jgi:hypothetical protein
MMRLLASTPAARSAPGLLGAATLTLALGAAGCGEAAPTGVDESGDLDGTAGGQTMAPRIVEMPVGLDGTQWRWTGASCTEGPLDLAARGFSSNLRIEQDGSSLLLTYDQVFANDGCIVTLLQTVSPPPTPGELRMEEVARVAVPSSPGCFGQPEPPRPGEVRRNGRILEVLVQRSRWCNGFEVTMTYEPSLPTLLSNEDIARRYVAHFTRGDAVRVAQLFSTAGALLESFTTTQTGDPFRHEGRDAVYAWYHESFAGSPWRAMRVVGFEPGATPQQTLMRWEYMDPRLQQPVAGHNVFTVAAGEIFEAEVALDGQPLLVGASSPAAR